MSTSSGSSDQASAPKFDPRLEALAAIADSTAAAVYTVDTQGVIRSWNAGAAQLYGYRAEEAVGQPRSLLLLPDRTDDTTRLVRQATEGELQQIESVHTHHDGTRIDVSVSAAPLRNEAGEVTGLGLLENDIGVRRARDRRLAAQHSVAYVLADARSMTTALPRLLHALGAGLGRRWAAFWQPNGKQMECISSWSRRSSEIQEFAAIRSAFVFGLGEGLVGLAWRDGYPIAVKDLRQDERFLMRTQLGGTGLTSGVFIPIKGQDRVLGVLEILGDKAEDDEELLLILTGIASQIGLYLERMGAESARDRLQQQKEQILNAAAEGVLGIDAMGNVDFANPAALSLIRTTADDLLGKPFHTAVHGGQSNADRERGQDCRIIGLLYASSVQRVEGETFWRPDGTQFPVDLVSAPMRESGGRLLGTVITFQDITERLAGERLREQFVSTVSHEIRTPMNAVIGMTRLLLDTPLNAEQSSYLAAVERSGQALLTIIDDILDYSKIQAGKIDIDRADFEPRELLRELVTLLDVQARPKGLHLQGTVLDDVPLALKGDSGRVRQILLNLMGNAIKFTERGKVQVLARPQSSRTGTSRVRFEVIDSAPLLSEEARRRIFEPYVQASASVARQHGGTGLGLAICLRLVDVMGGRIGVESRPGEGNTFWFELPFDEASPDYQPGPRDEHVPLQPQVGAGRRVLVVDDVPINRQLAAALLSRLGYESEVAESASQALDMLATWSYDAILMDVQMPEMDGLRATQLIREHGIRNVAGHRVPVIALTANAMRGDRERFLAAGMDDYLSKPIIVSDLSSVLARWTNAPAATAPPRDPLSVLKALRAYEGTLGAGTVDRLVELFMEDSPQRITAIETAIAMSDPVAMAAAAHALKGSASILGADEVGALCGELERLGRAGSLVDTRRLAADLRTALTGVEREFASSRASREAGA